MGSCPDTDIDPLFLSFNITCGISKFSSAKVKMIANLSCPGSIESLSARGPGKRDICLLTDFFKLS